jgi:hypothetical protein
MERVMLTAGSEADFLAVQCPVEVCDTQGKPVGFFLPLHAYKKLLANLAIPYSAEELERRRQEQGATSLQEFWHRLGRS